MDGGKENRNRVRQGLSKHSDGSNSSRHNQRRLVHAVRGLKCSWTSSQGETVSGRWKLVRSRSAVARLLDNGDDEATPQFVILFVLAAYVKDMSVSLILDMLGEQFTNMSVFAVPPRESCMICVSLWLR